MENSGYEEISIDDILSIFKKRLVFIFLPSIIAAIIAFVVVSFFPNAYESYALLRIGTISGHPLENIETTAKVMKTKPILAEITGNIAGNENTAAAMKKIVGEISYSSVGGLLEVRVAAFSPEEASKIVEAAVKVIQTRHQQILGKAQEGLDNTVKYLGEKTRSVNILSNINDFRNEPTRVEIPTVSNDAPVKSKRKLWSLAAFIIVLMMNTMVSFYQERKEK